MGSSGGGNDGNCLPYHKLLAAVALVMCAGGVLIGTGEGGNPCHSKTRDGVAFGTFCPTKKEDYCCPGSCGESMDGCMRSNLSTYTLAGIICMIGTCPIASHIGQFMYRCRGPFTQHSTALHGRLPSSVALRLSCSISK